MPIPVAVISYIKCKMKNSFFPNNHAAI